MQTKKQASTGPCRSFDQLESNSRKTLRTWSVVSTTVETITFISLVNYMAVLLQSSVEAPNEADQASIRTKLWPFLFFAAKFGYYLPQLVDHLWYLYVTAFGAGYSSQPLRIPGGGDDQDLPPVDLIITACGEDDDVVLDTVAAACCIDFPTSRFRILVSDDRASPKLHHKVTDMNKQHLNLYYRSRRKAGSTSTGFKAGNLNDAVRFLAEDLGDAAPWIAVLDADMIPEPGFLRILLAHATAPGGRTAMATLPQHFYNIPADDVLHQDVLPITEYDEIMRDRAQATWCPGTGFVLRRDALLDVGGFPESTISEDTLLGWLLQGRGWQIVYVNQKLQWGLQPDSFGGHIKQRSKWCVGHLNDSLVVGFGFGSCVKSMSIGQRLACCLYCIRLWTGVVLGPLSWGVVLLCLLSRASLVAPSSTASLRRVVLAHTMFWLCGRAYEITSSVTYGYQVRRRKSESATWMNCYLFRAALVEFLPSSLGGSRLGFTSTGTVRSAIRERDASLRPRLLTRIKFFHSEFGVLYFAAFFSGILVVWVANVRWAMGDHRVGFGNNNNNNNNYYYYSSSSSSQSDWLVSSLRSGLFPGLGLEQIFAFLVPAYYAVSPPISLDRRRLMTYKPPGVWRPRQEAMEPKWSDFVVVSELPPLLVTGWSIWASWHLYQMEE